jgi:hypothetical protein
VVTVAFMRIELPSASWATVHRAEDDAHTMTLAAQSASDWAPLQFLDEAESASAAVRAAVEAGKPLVLTLTF